MAQDMTEESRPLLNSIDRPRIPSYFAISALLSLLLTAIFYQLVVHAFCRGTHVETVFSDRGYIPYLTTYLMFVALLQLTILRFHLRRESKNLRTIAAFLQGQESMERQNAQDMSRFVDGAIRPRLQRGLVFSRVRRVLQRVMNKGSTSDVAALLSEQAEIDRAILSNSYATVKFIGWLIPVLGFIGTVSGISFAIADFDVLFQQNAANTDTAQVQTDNVEGEAEPQSSTDDNRGDALAPVTRNLGIAFDTTLLALIQVAVVFLVMFSVQRRGNEILNSFDEFCLDSLLGNIRGHGIPEEELPEPYRDLLNLLSGYMEDLEHTFEGAVQRVVDRLVENEQVRWNSFSETFREVASEHHKTIQTTCESLAQRSSELSEGLRQWEPQFRESLTELVSDIKEIETQRVQQIGDKLGETSNRMSESHAELIHQIREVEKQRVEETSDRLTDTVSRIGSQLADSAENWRATSEQMTQGQAEMIGSIREFEQQHAKETCRKLDESVAAVANELAKASHNWSDTGDRMLAAQVQASADLKDALSKIESVLHSSDELRTIQQTLTTNLAALERSNQMVQTIEQVGASLDQLEPVLRKLQRPTKIVMQYVEEPEEQDGRPQTS
ncbi:MAG: MotA/TolQ/ExbB proton channel family protein [Planctomycetes bacterium]|nr:MotA/TolQ/ExbB proton channel family protein [Planctomycetota bacterium]